MRDVSRARKQLIIESPFITSQRVYRLLPILKDLRRRGVEIIINTRDPEEHEDEAYQVQAAEAVALFHTLDIVVLHTTRLHRKLAVIDGKITWEGSLNILSFGDSCEIMRRISSSEEARTLIAFIKLEKFMGAPR
jgi:phosphatidylserine/phosphatidylglycerophosphate/cardiolipin synthase-like enzyme